MNDSSSDTDLVVSEQGKILAPAMSRSRKKNREEAFSAGLEKLQYALENKTSVHRVAYNPNVKGWIDLDWGKLGEIINKMTYQTQGAMGLVHIIDKRSIEVPLSPEQVAGILRKMVKTLIEGEVRTRKGRIALVYKSFKVGLGKIGGNHFVVTGAGSYKTEAVPSADLGTAIPLPVTSQARDNLSAGSRNRNVSVLASIIAEKRLLFKAPEVPLDSRKVDFLKEVEAILKPRIRNRLVLEKTLKAVSARYDAAVRKGLKPVLKIRSADKTVQKEKER